VQHKPVLALPLLHAVGIWVEPGDISLSCECDGDLPIVLPAGHAGRWASICTGLSRINSKKAGIRGMGFGDAYGSLPPPPHVFLKYRSYTYKRGVGRRCLTR
jgi:hypothetical protein